jgi:hypothetical protein
MLLCVHMEEYRVASLTPAHGSGGSGLWNNNRTLREQHAFRRDSQFSSPSYRASESSYNASQNFQGAIFRSGRQYCKASLIRTESEPLSKLVVARIREVLLKYVRESYKMDFETKLHGLSPRATTACRRSDCQLVRIDGATWSA